MFTHVVVKGSSALEYTITLLTERIRIHNGQ